MSNPGRGILATPIAGVLCFILSASQTAPLRGDGPLQEATTNKRVALVIGNDKYADSPLQNGGNDARAMGAVLADLGFEVVPSFDEPLKALELSIDRFLQRLGPGVTALVFYAGHGVQVKGENYLLPIDFRLTDEADIPYRTYSVPRLYERIADRRPSLQILILDACRDNPFRGSRSSTRGLAKMASTQQGSLIAFSTLPGSVAYDAPERVNSVYTSQLMAAMVEPGLSLEEVFRTVASEVAKISKSNQVPTYTSSLQQRFSFTPATTSAAKTAGADAERMLWDMVAASDTPALVEAYLTHHPKGRYATQAKAKQALLRLSAPAGEAAPAVGRRPTIAVVPFQNLSRRADVAWIGPALASSLRTDFGIGERLRVVASGPRSTTTVQTAPDADYAVSGTFLTTGLDLPIRVDVTVSRNGRAAPVGIFSENATKGDLIGLIERIGRKTRELLVIPALTPTQNVGLSTSLPASPEGLRLYGDAVDKLRLGDAAGAVESLMRLTTLEPEFSMGFARLASAYSALGLDQKARASALRARQLAVSLPREAQLSVNATGLDVVAREALRSSTQARVDRAFVDVEYYAVNAEWQKVVDVRRGLFELFPDDLDHALDLASAQMRAGKSRDALATIDTVRRTISAARQDVRVGLMEAEAYLGVSEYPRARTLAAEAAAAALAQNAMPLAARARMTEAWALRRSGDSKESAPINEQAIRLYEQAGDRAGMTAVMIQVGADLRANGQLDQATDVLNRAADLARTLGDRRKLGAALNNLGNISFDQHKFDLAHAKYADALTIFQEVQDRSAIAKALNNVASTLYEMGKPEDALELDRQSLALKRETGDRRGVAFSLGNIAETETDRGELRRAAEMYEEARAINEDLKNNAEISFQLLGFATVRYWQGRLPEAKAAADRALTIRTDLKDASGTIDAHMLIARTEIAGQDCQSAVTRLAKLQNESSTDAELKFSLTTALIEAWTCAGDLTSAAKAAEDKVDGQPARALLTRLIARAALATAQKKTAEALSFLGEARTLSAKLQSRLTALAIDVLELEIQTVAGAATAERRQSVQQRAAAMEAGLLVSKVERLGRRERPQR